MFVKDARELSDKGFFYGYTVRVWACPYTAAAPRAHHTHHIPSPPQHPLTATLTTPSPQPWVWAALFLGSGGGLLIAFVVKYADNILKVPLIFDQTIVEIDWIVRRII